MVVVEKREAPGSAGGEDEFAAGQKKLNLLW
jgi:hypothetical protein